MSRKATSKNILKEFVELYENNKLTKDVADTLAGAVAISNRTSSVY